MDTGLGDNAGAAQGGAFLELPDQGVARWPTHITGTTIAIDGGMTRTI